MSKETNYYHVENCNRHIHGPKGERFTFDPYEQVGGCWFGVYATSDDDEIVTLDALTKDSKSAVTVISAEDYAKAQKKKLMAQPNFGPSIAPSARAVTGDAPDVASLSGQVPNVDPDVNVPNVPQTPASTQSAADNVGQVTAPAAPKANGRKSK